MKKAMILKIKIFHFLTLLTCLFKQITDGESVAASLQSEIDTLNEQLATSNGDLALAQ